jgi:hypothetical protein
MGRTFLKYATGMISLYLLVAYASGSGRVISAASTGATNLVKGFQGRS